jgi:tRNA pseudouridine32 synthase / 23S rRNA pseudouridine746 synthase
MFELIYQDDDLLVVNKPANLLCVPGLSSPDNLFDRVRRQFPNARMLHRLDMATSGLVIFPLNHNSQKNLSHQFEKHWVHKRYMALVKGQIQSKYGEIVAPMMCDWPNRPKQKVDWLNGKKAHTHFELIEQSSSQSLVYLQPITGRTHQLRIHCQFWGHPILGDQLYYPGCTSARLMLHAETLTFAHPRSTIELSLQAPVPFSLANS